MTTLTLQAAWRRDKRLILLAIVICTALGWIYLLRGPGEGAMMQATGLWTMVGISVLMWSVMAVAMMLPTATPMILTFARVQERRLDDGGGVAVALFVAGYLVIWIGFGLVAAALQTLMHHLTLSRVALGSNEGMLAALLLIVAGGFQISTLKEACLTKCRTPLGFLLTQWHEGRRGAVLMGLHHGGVCLGCCWALMLLMFAGGVMNLVWMAALTVYMLLEKLVPRSWRFSQLTGAALILGGGLLLFDLL